MFRGGAFTQLGICLLALVTSTTPAFAQLLPFGAFNKPEPLSVEALEEVPAIPSTTSRNARETLLAPKKLLGKIPSPTYAEAGENISQPTEGAVEMITERYEDGKVRVQRYVRQDANRNYVNHGQWTAYSRQGKLLAQGEFYDGKLHGKWTRQVAHLGVESGFRGPFTSEAEFYQGELEGTWTIFDAAQRLVTSWEFKEGKLHGKMGAWFPNGQQKSEMSFLDGQPNGDAVLYTSQGRLVRKDYYREGKQLIPVVSRYDNKQKETEGWLLRSNFTFTTHFDWWNGIAEIHREQSSGDDQKIGKWVQWHRNGQLKYVGHFEKGDPGGSHTWWHENGQRQLAGEYETGLREGLWTRWYSNGQRHEEGEYLAGAKFGEWTNWDDQGQVASAQHSPSREENVGVPRANNKRQVSYPRVGQ